MQIQPKILPSRADINAYFFTLLEVMGQWGWGFNESINIFYIIPTIIFTLGWALGEVWTPFGLHWEAVLAGLFFIHLITGIILFMYFAKKAASLQKEEKARLKRRAKLSIGHLLIGYLWIIAYTIYVNILLLFDKSSAPTHLNYSATRTVFCLLILLYTNVVFLLYRKYPTGRLEGGVGFIDLFLWTGLIVITGGFQSHFFYLYFLTLSPAFRRGIPDFKKHEYTSLSASTARVSLLKEIYQQFVQGCARIYHKHNQLWNVLVIYPFLWLGIAQMVGAYLFLILDGGTPHIEIQNAAWLTRYLVVLGHFYLSGAPWLLISVIMAVTMEIETDRLRTLSELMEVRANVGWSESLKEVVAELGSAVVSNNIFRCSGILAATVKVRFLNTSKQTIKDCEIIDSFQLEGIENIHSKEIEELLKRVDEAKLLFRHPLPDDENSILSYMKIDEQSGTERTFGIITEYFYYLDEASERRRFQALLSPFDLKNEPSHTFFERAKSLCCVVVPHPIHQHKDNSSSYTIVFFKTELPGEYDGKAAKFYEALSAQVIGILRKHDLFVEESRRAERESARANIGAGMFHNLAHYILPLREDSYALRVFVEQRRFDYAEETTSSIEGTIYRLAQFQSAVLRQIGHRDAYQKPNRQSLKDVPREALLIQTKFVGAALRGLSRHHNNPSVKLKYIMLLRNLCPGGEILDVEVDEDRKRLQELIIKLGLAQRVVVESPDMGELLKWWAEQFGLRIEIKGDFNILRGDVPLIFGVLAELFLNALVSTSQVIAFQRSGEQSAVEAQSLNIILEGVEDERGGAIYIKNLSLKPLNKEELFQEPTRERGWGLFAMKLLTETAGGRLEVLNDEELENTSTTSPLWVGFKIILNGGEHQ